MAQASKNSKPEITSIPQEDIDEAIAALTPAKEDLAGGTVRETNTVYEDRSARPTADAELEYESSEEPIGADGTIITTYGAPVGGFPSKEAE